MNQNSVRYAVAGLGRAGWDIHINQLRNREDARIVAVVDADETRCAQARNELGCRTCHDLASLLQEDDIDVVILATPSVLHAPQAIQVLSSGRHVVVEKPMAMNVAEADEMIATAHGSNRKLFVHQNYRFSSLALHLRQVVDSGILGNLYHVRVHISYFIRRNDWQTLVKNGGGTLNNTVPHSLDVVLQLVKSPVVQVMGDLRRITSAGDAEDHVKALIRTECGTTIDIEISNAQENPHNPFEWMLCGANGTLICTETESRMRWFDPGSLPALAAVDAAAPNRSYGNSEAIKWQEKHVLLSEVPEAQFYDNVADVLQRGKPMSVTPESVREVIRVIAQIRAGTAFPGTVAR